MRREVSLNPRRIDLSTKEEIIIAEINYPLRPTRELHAFIDSYNIFITDRISKFEEGRIITRYGILDLENQDITFIIKENFAYGNIEIGAEIILISEHVSLGPALTNTVIIFDKEEASSKYIILHPNTNERTSESVWARLSYDENYIVTINDDYSVFRKYDFYESLIAEIDIEIPIILEFPSFMSEEDIERGTLYHKFEMVALSEKIYVIHTIVRLQFFGWDLSEHHFQTVVLP